MKVENKSDKKFIKFLNGKAFYVVLCICFLAVGVATWTGIEGMKRIKEAESSSQNQGSGSDFGGYLEINSDTGNTGTTSVESKPQKPVDTASKPEADASKPEKTEQTAAPVATYFINPCLGDIIKDFSDTELQFSLTMQDMRLHCGIDISADNGSPVVACGDGIVTEIYEDSMYGTVVVIDHGNGITAKYCGLNAAPTVKVGQTVNSSNQLGSVAVVPFESVEPRHLHLEFFKDGKPVSPLKYIQQ